MKTLTIEIDGTIYKQVIDFLKLFPEHKCHVFETPTNTPSPKALTITSAFGLVKTPITATLEDIEKDAP